MTKTYVYRNTEDWAPKEGDVIEGAVTEKGQMKIGDKDRGFILLDVAGQLRRVWHNAGLDDAFAHAETGVTMRIQYLGTVALDGGRTFKRFAVSMWVEGPSAPPK
jgi:hypothetical protein